MCPDYSRNALVKPKVPPDWLGQEKHRFWQGTHPKNHLIHWTCHHCPKRWNPPPTRVQQLCRHLFRMDVQYSPPTMWLQPCHQFKRILCTEGSEDLSPKSSGSEGMQRLCQRKPENWTNLPLKITPSIPFFLHKEEGWKTSPHSRLSIPEQPHYQKHLPIIPCLWSHQQPPTVL